FLLRREQSRLYAMLLSPLKQRWRKQEIGGLHIFFPPGAFVEVRVARYAMLVGPDTATNGGVIGISNRRHRVFDTAEEAPLPPLRQHGHLALLKILESESVAHQHNDALRQSLGESRCGEKHRARSKKISSVHK